MMRGGAKRNHQNTFNDDWKVNRVKAGEEAKNEKQGGRIPETDRSRRINCYLLDVAQLKKQIPNHKNGRITCMRGNH